jgi:two-component system, NtrC family, response regulator
MPNEEGPKPKLLIVEDDDTVRSQMRWALSQDYEVFLTEDRAGALEIVKRERPPVVTLDLGLPPRPAGVEDGFSALADILAKDPSIKVIIITGRDEKENAIRAVEQGAYDFLPKPIQMDELKIILGRAFYLSQLERECKTLRENAGGESFEGMIGNCPKMQKVFETIRKVATSDAPVLVIGESGTGKELVAKAISRLSLRRNGPFVVINCGAIPENLLESELFGHEKGSFTGAHIQRKGRFEIADGGTLFLDEIGELPLSLQVKLLRFLQDQKIERIGGREQIFVDTRILAATNKDLKEQVKNGKFREDLYYRIGVVSVSLPSLRDRGEDILLLAPTLLRKYANENQKNLLIFSEQSIKAIKQHDWPGNIRELENRIKRAVILADGKKISPADLELSSPLGGVSTGTLKEARESVERDIIRKSLAKNKGNLTRVAEELGISRPTLYEIMEKLGIRKDRG